MEETDEVNGMGGVVDESGFNLELPNQKYFTKTDKCLHAHYKCKIPSDEVPKNYTSRYFSLLLKLSVCIFQFNTDN